MAFQANSELGNKALDDLVSAVILSCIYITHLLLSTCPSNWFLVPLTQRAFPHFSAYNSLPYPLYLVNSYTRIQNFCHFLGKDVPNLPSPLQRVVIDSQKIGSILSFLLVCNETRINVII